MLRSATYVALALSAGFAGSSASDLVETASDSPAVLQEEVADQSSATIVSDDPCASFNKEAAAAAKLACEEAAQNSTFDACADESFSSSDDGCANDGQLRSIQSLQEVQTTAKPNGCK